MSATHGQWWKVAGRTHLRPHFANALLLSGLVEHLRSHGWVVLAGSVSADACSCDAIWLLLCL